MSFCRVTFFRICFSWVFNTSSFPQPIKRKREVSLLLAGSGKLVQMKSVLKSNVIQCVTAPSGLIRACVLMLTTTPPPGPPASLWHRSCMCVGLGEFSGACRRREVAFHSTVSCLPGPKQSVAGPVSACASQTRLNNLPPLCSSFHILTSQTSEVCGMKLAPSQACVSSRCLQWSGPF